MSFIPARIEASLEVHKGIKLWGKSVLDTGFFYIPQRFVWGVYKTVDKNVDKRVF